MEKTNAMRILDKAKISYRSYSYSHTGAIDGMAVAAYLSKSPTEVFKTLVTKGAGDGHYVFVIPVCGQLKLKEAAKAVGEKSVSMVPVKDINKLTGYIRGGCSPVGMKKLFPTVFDISCLKLTSILVSAGKIGMQIEVAPKDLINLLHAQTAPLAEFSEDAAE